MRKLPSLYSNSARVTIETYIHMHHTLRLPELSYIWSIWGYMAVLLLTQPNVFHFHSLMQWWEQWCQRQSSGLLSHTHFFCFQITSIWNITSCWTFSISGWRGRSQLVTSLTFMVLDQKLNPTKSGLFLSASPGTLGKGISTSTNNYTAHIHNEAFLSC